MKKYFKLLILVVMALVLAGCGSESAKLVKTCTATQTDTTNGYKIESEYKVYGKGDIVTSVESTETVISDNEAILEYFETNINNTYDTLNSTYGGYDFKVTNSNGKVVSSTKIDYSKMDLKKFVSDNSAMKNYVNSDNEILITGIVNLYETMGATCK